MINNMKRCASVLSLNSKNYDELCSQINWAAMNKSVAISALMEMKREGNWNFDLGFLLYECDDSRVPIELIGVASTYGLDSKLHITYMATKESGKGYGKAFMYELCKHAERFNQSIELTSIATSRGFYEAIGMMQSPTVSCDYYYTLEDVKKYIDNVEKFGIYGV